MLATVRPALDESRRARQLYAAALRLFREKGYHATSMQDIAAAVGLNKASLYHYINGKEDLLLRAFEEGLDPVLADLEAIAARADLEPCVQLELVIGAHVQAVAHNLDALTVYFLEWRSLDERAFAEVKARRDRYFTLLAGLVQRGMDAGAFRVQDAQLATLAILGICNWLCQWYRASGRLQPEEIGHGFSRLVLDGLRAAPELPGPPSTRPAPGPPPSGPASEPGSTRTAG